MHDAVLRLNKIDFVFVFIGIDIGAIELVIIALKTRKDAMDYLLIISKSSRMINVGNNQMYPHLQLTSLSRPTIMVRESRNFIVTFR